MNKTAIITGVTGQDGSYLSELLLSKGYEVVGWVRRSSTNHINERLKDVEYNEHFHLVEADLSDYGSVSGAYNTSRQILEGAPSEFYNLAAQSHVGTSFTQKDFTTMVDLCGVYHCLDCIVDKGDVDKTRFLQASTSELMGSNYDMIEYKGQTLKAQNENTNLLPNSPYAIAKLGAHHAVRMYREGYGLHASCSICYNHETLTYNMPLIVKINEEIDILPIGDIARFYTGIIFNLDNKLYQEGEPIKDIHVWDDNGWTKVLFVSGYPHIEQEQKYPRIINAKNGVYSATNNHIVIMDDNSEVKTSDINVGDTVKLIDYPSCNINNDISLEMAEFLGMMVGDGNISRNKVRFTNKNTDIKKRFSYLWNMITGNQTKEKSSYSGFNGEEVGQVYCLGNYNFDIDIYTNDISVFGHRNKKVPKCILNSNKDIMEAFLVGYNICDGLKAGYGRYRFKNFKTNSATLAAGLIFLVKKVTNQNYNITVEESYKWGKQQFYYSINLLSDKNTSIEKYTIVTNMIKNNISRREINEITGIGRCFIDKVFNGYIPSNHHLLIENNKVKKIIDIPNYNGWFFDLETESGTFHAGIGQLVVHNSPRRGEHFVTRKITKYVAELRRFLKRIDHPHLPCLIYSDPIVRIECPSIENLSFDYLKLRLGNTSACRDWSHAKDMVNGMYLMLQQDEPDDYILSSGETHSVEDFAKLCFGYVGYDYRDFIYIDEELYRPVDVEYLLGIPEKAETKLGWTREYSFNDLVVDMMEAELGK